MGKVKFGAKDFLYGVVTNELVPEEPVKLPGLTEVKMELKNELKAIAADDGPYVTLSGGISEATLDVKLWDINTKAKQDWFGIDVKKGVEMYSKDLTPNDIAVMFKTHMEDGTGVYVGMLKGKFSLPGIDTKTVDGAPDPTADESTGTFAPRGDADSGMMVVIGREDAEDFDLEAFKKYVFPKTEEDVKALDTASTPTA
ncbi:major tail protein [Companilactobacillus mishanensis]|uniref:Phage tail protein n=1 Tax=Companilactobacillus mishanensis TaxID=2486008 RepID=A0A5P0ZGQ0_9LACO|nr:major tail protein [Companilactobacillus mishanensis]MQS52172.1 phage tail protein [Companilactobacillus mishanensis]